MVMFDASLSQCCTATDYIHTGCLAGHQFQGHGHQHQQNAATVQTGYPSVQQVAPPVGLQGLPRLQTDLRKQTLQVGVACQMTDKCLPAKVVRLLCVCGCIGHGV